MNYWVKEYKYFHGSGSYAAKPPPERVLAAERWGGFYPGSTREGTHVLSPSPWIFFFFNSHGYLNKQKLILLIRTSLSLVVISIDPKFLFTSGYLVSLQIPTRGSLGDGTDGGPGSGGGGDSSLVLCGEQGLGN